MNKVANSAENSFSSCPQHSDLPTYHKDRELSGEEDLIMHWDCPLLPSSHRTPDQCYERVEVINDCMQEMRRSDAGI